MPDSFGKMPSQEISAMNNNPGSEAPGDPGHSDRIRDAVGSNSSPPILFRRSGTSIVRDLSQPALKAADGFSMGTASWISPDHEPLTSARSFIGGLSHCYNNLLMGIWGNASLIAMVLDKLDPFQSWMTQLEEFIQNGSKLIHLLFGYIAERRSAARQLRFKQLIMELDASRSMCGEGIDLSLIEGCIAELSRDRSRTQIAASFARVIDQMHFLLCQKRSLIDAMSLPTSKTSSYLEKIDSLLNRGTKLILNLQFYAGVRVPIKKPVCLKTVVQHRIDKIVPRNPRLGLILKDPAPVPPIDADLYQINHALDQLLHNAFQAVSDKGKIEIELNTLHSESPEDRCGVHMLRDYAVIAVKDTGMGMKTSVQSKIFEPFFTSIKGQGRSGLGLSAAAGIVRAHGGYIHVRSTAGEGSTFKIYLPVG
jgi:signal transduction histidine kinase